jgi:hypothetical protein
MRLNYIGAVYFFEQKYYFCWLEPFITLETLSHQAFIFRILSLYNTFSSFPTVTTLSSSFLLEANAFKKIRLY